MRKLMINIEKILITVVLTILAFKYAKIERGYNAFGGEVVIPLLCWIILFFSTKNG